MRRHFLGSIAILILTTAGAAAQSGLPATSQPLNNCNGGDVGSDTINRDCTTGLPKPDIPSASQERELLRNDPAATQGGSAIAGPSDNNANNSTSEGSSGSAIGGGSTGGNPAVSGGRL